MRTAEQMYADFKMTEPAVKASASAAGIRLGENMILDESEFDSDGLPFLAEHPEPPICGECKKPIRGVPIILWSLDHKTAAVLHSGCAEPRFSRRGFAA